MKSREAVTSNGKAVFYASIYNDLCQKAHDCGWALGLHGSLSNDMDIMAMPWTEGAKTVEEMIQSLSDCFDESPFKELHTIPHYGKPNNRVVYTMSIWKDFYLDINVIQNKEGGKMENKEEKEIKYCSDCEHHTVNIIDNGCWACDIRVICTLLNREVARYGDPFDIATIPNYCPKGLSKKA